MDNVQAQAEGYITGTQVTVTPIDVQPGGTIHIRAVFENASWLPACGVLELVLDGAVIYTIGDYFPFCMITADNYVWEEDYTLPTSIASGVSHRIIARESGQTTVIAFADFIVSSPAPPGQRNVSFSSIPSDAQIYINGTIYGTTPFTVPLTPGVYNIIAELAGSQLTRTIFISPGSGSQSIQFNFPATPPSELITWLKNNTIYLVGGAIGLSISYLILKKPAVVKKGISQTQGYIKKGIAKGKEVLREYESK